MKQKFENFLLSGWCHPAIFAPLVMLVVIVAVLLSPGAKAQPQISIYQVTTLSSPTNLPAIVTTGATSNTTSIINVPQKENLALTWRFNVSSGTSTASLQLVPSVDGTNYDSVPWQLNRSANGATDQVATTNWSYLQLAGYRTLKIFAMTNANGGTLTNKQLTWGVVNP